MKNEKTTRAAAAVAAIAIAAAAGLAGCSGEESAARREAAPAPLEVRLAAAPAPRPRTVEAAGTVAAEDRIELTSRIAAYVEALPAREGDAVREGDVIARLDKRDVEAALHAAEAKLAVARAALRDAELDREKIDALYRDGLVSNNDWRKIHLKRDAAKADLGTAEGLAQAARNQLRYVEIRAPRDGRIVRVLRNTGDMAVPGLPIAVLDTESAPKFEFRVPQSAADVVRPGAEGVVDLDGRAEPVAVVIERVSASADPIARTYFARAAFGDDAVKIARPGMFGRIRIASGEAVRRFVPASALTRLGGLEGVFVAEPCGGRTCARFHWLRIGERDAAEAEVLAGLERVPASARFVDAPPANLADGAEIAGADK